MSKLNKKCVIKCSFRFKELLNEITQQAGLFSVKRYKDYKHHVGVSALIDVSFTSGRIEVMGDYAKRIDQIRRVSINFATNVRQILSVAGMETVQVQGQSIPVSRFLDAYVKAAEPALVILSDYASRPFHLESQTLSQANALIGEAENGASETTLTFAVSKETHGLLKQRGLFRQQCADMISNLKVMSKSLKLKPDEEAIFKIINENFLALNNLATKLNSQNVKGEKVDATSAAKELNNLKQKIQIIGQS